MNPLKPLISLFLILVSVLQPFAQTSQPADDYLPPSPTVAGLGKYVDAPINLATGTPGISIPIYEIVCRDFRLPITLSYHAGGFRVEEDASWVGLGWSVNAGGVITRNIRHILDGQRNSFFNTYDGRDLNPWVSAEYTDLFRLANAPSGIDGYPDLYIYNFNGHSGKFIYVNGQPYFLPKQPLKLGGMSPMSPEITDEHGNTYYFNTTEQALTRSSTTASFETVSWYLTKIVTARNEEIKFYYKDTHFYQQVNRSETKTYKVLNTGVYQYQGLSHNSFVTRQMGKELWKIVFPHGTVEFLSEYDRQDISTPAGAVGALRLTKIKVTDNQNVVQKIYNLQQDYFSKGSRFSDKRLKLFGLYEGVEQKTWRFDYNTGVDLPAKDSKSQDHWGYYNGKNNASLVPDYQTIYGCDSPPRQELSKIREPDEDAVKSGLLTRITYPTGGYTEYEYECHDYSFTSTGQIPAVQKKDNIVKQPDIWVSAYTNNPIYTPSTRQTESSTFSFSQTQCIRIAVSIDYPAQYETGSSSQAKVELYQTFPNDWPDDGPPLVSNDILLETFIGEGHRDYYLTLNSGSYKIKAIGTMSGCFVSAHVYGPESFDLVMERRRFAGGVRVSKIVENDNINPPIVRRLTYHEQSNPNISSGVLLDEPNYVSSYYVYEDLGEICTYNERMMYSITSHSNTPLGAGNHITYREVQVYYGESGENGKTISTFTTDPNLTHGTDSDVSWRRGLLQTATHFDRDGRKLKLVENEYGFVGQEMIFGLMASFQGKHPCAPPTNFIAGWPAYFKQTVSKLASEHFYLKKQWTTEYTYTGDTLKTKQEYFYDNIRHLQPTRVITTGTHGKRYIEFTSYPDDFVNTSGFINDLKIAHTIVPTEKILWKEEADKSSPSIISAQLFLYNTGGKGLLQEVKQMESGIVPASTFKFADRALGSIPPSGSAGLFSPDPRYTSKSVITYNGSDNPVQVTRSNDSPVSYIWGYRNSLPIGKFVNAAADQVAYTGFENDNEGNWEPYTTTATIGGRTGERGYTGVLTKTNLPSGQYEITLWVKSGTGTPSVSGLTPLTESDVNGWIRYIWSGSLSGTVTIFSNGAIIDDVALYPLRSIPSLFTYHPLKGITSFTDSNGKTVFYEYDPGGRLTDILDYRRNIEKHYSYKYVLQDW